MSNYTELHPCEAQLFLSQEQIEFDIILSLTMQDATFAPPQAVQTSGNSYNEFPGKALLILIWFKS